MSASPRNPTPNHSFLAQALIPRSTRSPCAEGEFWAGRGFRGVLRCQSGVRGGHGRNLGVVCPQTRNQMN
eukprot:11179763-Lingulodinium_polyedra.AAC.1